MPNIKSSIFVCERKTGTVMYNNILREYARKAGYRICIPVGGNKKNNTKIESFLSLIHNWYKTKHNTFYVYNNAAIIENDTKIPIFVLVRDPRDMCISAAHYDSLEKSSDVVSNNYKDYNDKTKGMSLEEKIIYQADYNTLHTLETIKKFLVNHNNNNIVILKYEDIFNSDTIAGKISDKLHITGFNKSVFMNLFKSKNIKYGYKDSHIRDGSVAQYKQLSTDTQEKLNIKLKQYIELFGYEL